MSIPGRTGRAAARADRLFHRNAAAAKSSCRAAPSDDPVFIEMDIRSIAERSGGSQKRSMRREVIRLLELKKVSMASKGEKAHICLPCCDCYPECPCLPFYCSPTYPCKIP